MNKQAIVIGAGIAGLAAALRLRKQGFDVSVFEAAGFPGGKLREFSLNGYRFDYGPSLFTMPQLVDELFSLFGENPSDHFRYLRKENICNYFWTDGTRFNVPADEEKFIQTAATTFNEEPNSLKKYLARNARKYRLTAPLFIEKSLHKVSTYLSKNTLRAISRLFQYDLLQTLNGVNKSFFTNKKLVQLFNRYATYNGSSPYQTPGIMSMIPHLEMHFGAFLPEGGMHDITNSLYELALRQGIDFRFNEKVEQIDYAKGQVSGVTTSQGQYKAALVVSNMDIYSTYQHLLPDYPAPQHIMKQERSSSALIFYWGIKKEFPELDLHNILFSDNYEEEFRHIFELDTVYQDPTVYINITSKNVPSDAPKGSENWFVMVNVPANTGQDWQELIPRVREQVLRKTSLILGEDIEKLIEAEDVLDPIRIEVDTSSHQGSLYGTSSNSKMAAFLRHANFSGKLKNLYFVGGSVHPGGGIPLCLNSAKITSEIISHDYR